MTTTISLLSILRRHKTLLLWLNIFSTTNYCFFTAKVDICYICVLWFWNRRFHSAKWPWGWMERSECYCHALRGQYSLVD
jgi:hypothetical protein